MKRVTSAELQEAAEVLKRLHLQYSLPWWLLRAVEGGAETLADYENKDFGS